MQRPKRSHWEAALKTVTYLKNSPGQCILLQAEYNQKLTCQCDSDWAAFPNTRSSVTGYAVKFGESLITWKSKKQQIVSRSSAEAEYRSVAATMEELTWLKGLFEELDVKIDMPINICSDSMSAIQIAENPIFHE